MIVLSLFDGMSCGRVALERAGIKPSVYFAAEIDKYAIKIAQKNFPDTIQLGDVIEVRKLAEAGFFGKIDLLIGGSPCQGFSFAGKQLAFDDPRSALFFEYVKTLKALQRDNPDIKFLFENVRMKKEYLEVITEYLEVEPVCINSALVSAQNRVRYYWANWKITQPEDRGLLLKDVIQGEFSEPAITMSAGQYASWNDNFVRLSDNKRVKGVSQVSNGLRPHQGDERKSGISELGIISTPDGKSSCITSSHPPKITDIKGGGQGNRVYSEEGKAPSLLAQSGGTAGSGSALIGCIRVGTAIDINGHDTIKRVYSPEGKYPTITANSGGNQEKKVAIDEVFYRKLTPIECERLMGLEDNYTEGVSNSQRYKMCGNGWETNTVTHIFECLKESVKDE